MCSIQQERRISMERSSSAAFLPCSHSSSSEFRRQPFPPVSSCPLPPNTITQRYHARPTGLLGYGSGPPFPFWQAEIGVEHLFVELFALDLFRVLRATLSGITNATCLRLLRPEFHSDNLLTISLASTHLYSLRSERRNVYGLGAQQLAQF